MPLVYSQVAVAIKTMTFVLLYIYTLRSIASAEIRSENIGLSYTSTFLSKNYSHNHSCWKIAKTRNGDDFLFIAIYSSIATTLLSIRPVYYNFCAAYCRSQGRVANFKLLIVQRHDQKLLCVFS